MSDTMPRQRGQRGGPRRGRFRGRNDFYVGRVSLPQTDLKSILERNVDVEQVGGRLTSLKSSMDFFIPKVVYDSPNGAFDIGNQSETFTAWRGLSSTGAEELFIWSNIYDAVLKQRNECGLYSANLSSIAVDMVEHYEQRPPTGLNWFFSAPNIYQRVERFLSMSRDKPRLQIEEFGVPVEGHEYILAPQVMSTSDNLRSGFAREIVYSTSANWLSLDASSHLFNGIIPHSPPRKITVKAKVIEYLDERVRLEHVIRTTINLSARAGTSANEDLAKVFVNPVVDPKIVNKNPKPKKQVSFVDEHETDSLHSSPDHLRSFFNNLAALTCDPTNEKASQELVSAKQSLGEVIALNGNPVPTSIALPDAKAALGPFEESSIGDTSQGTTVSAADGPRRRRLASANSSAQLYPHLPQACSEQGESFCGKLAPRPESAASSLTSRSAGLNDRHICVRHSSSSERPMSNATGEKPQVFLTDGGTNLDLEVALGLSNSRYGIADNMPEPNVPTPLVFRNRFNSLSKCRNMDRPTQACESFTGSEAESQHDDYPIMEQAAFGFNPSTTEADDYEFCGSSKDLWIKLYQWNWKGWEQEIGVNKRSNSDLLCEDSETFLSYSLGEGKLGTRLAKSKGPQNTLQDEIENNRAMPSSRSLHVHGKVLSLTPSCTTTNTGSRNSSETSWTLGDEAIVLGRATNLVGKSTTLYDTVRNQFHQDHQVRQMSSPRHSKSSSTRGALSSLFSSNCDPPTLTETSPEYVKEDLSVSSSGRRNDNATASGFQIYEYPASPRSLSSGDEHDRDIGSIAAAVKNSLAAEVQGQDGREEAEIRKGILHHQVMELRRNERRRDFGSSNYDDMFWSSDGVSVDGREDSGMN